MPPNSISSQLSDDHGPKRRRVASAGDWVPSFPSPLRSSTQSGDFADEEDTNTNINLAESEQFVVEEQDENIGGPRIAPLTRANLHFHRAELAGQQSNTGNESKYIASATGTESTSLLSLRKGDTRPLDSEGSSFVDMKEFMDTHRIYDHLASKVVWESADLKNLREYVYTILSSPSAGVSAPFSPAEGEGLIDDDIPSSPKDTIDWEKVKSARALQTVLGQKQPSSMALHCALTSAVAFTPFLKYNLDTSLSEDCLPIPCISADTNSPLQRSQASLSETLTMNIPKPTIVYGINTKALTGTQKEVLNTLSLGLNEKEVGILLVSRGLLYPFLVVELTSLGSRNEKNENEENENEDEKWKAKALLKARASGAACVNALVKLFSLKDAESGGKAQSQLESQVESPALGPVSVSAPTTPASAPGRGLGRGRARGRCRGRGRGQSQNRGQSRVQDQGQVVVQVVIPVAASGSSQGQLSSQVQAPAQGSSTLRHKNKDNTVPVPVPHPITIADAKAKMPAIAFSLIINSSRADLYVHFCLDIDIPTKSSVSTKSSAITYSAVSSHSTINDKGKGKGKEQEKEKEDTNTNIKYYMHPIAVYFLNMEVEVERLQKDIKGILEWGVERGVKEVEELGELISDGRAGRHRGGLSM